MWDTPLPPGYIRIRTLAGGSRQSIERMGVIGKVFKAWEIAAGFGGFGYSQFIAPGLRLKFFYFSRSLESWG